MPQALFSSLRMRLVALVLLAVVPALALVLYSGIKQRQLAAVEVQQEVLRLTRLAVRSQERLVDGTQPLLIALAQLPQVRSGDPAGCQTLFANLLRQYPGYANLGVIGLDGHVFCSGIPLNRPVNLADRTYFQQALQTHDFSVGNYQMGRISGKATLNFAYPVLNETGQAQAVVFAALDLAWFSQLITENQLPAGAVLTVIDGHGTILARYPNLEKWTGQSLPEAPLIKTILAQGEGMTEGAGVDGVSRLYVFMPLINRPDGGAGAYVTIGIPTAIAFTKVDQILARQLVGLGLVGLLALGAAWFGSELFLMRQVKVLVKATQRLSGGDLSARAELAKGAGELSQLAHAFDTMATALQQRECEHQRVEQEISARNRELTLLNQIIAVSASGQDVEAILETTCSELGRAFNMTQVTATLLNEERNELVVVARYAASEAALAEMPDEAGGAAAGSGIPVDRRQPLVRTLLNLSGPLVASEAQNDPRLVSIREGLRQRGIVSVLVLPLREEEAVLGSLNLEGTEARLFSSEEVGLAWSVADQVASALNRIRLERKRAEAEAEMRANEERFRQVVASVSDHIYMSEITGEGEHLNRYISPNVEELTGYGFEEFVRDASFWPEVVIYGEDRAAAAAQLSRLQQGENSEVEYRLVRADGQVIWVRDNGRVVAQGGSVLIYGVVSDVTERKQAEMALLEERALLAGRVTERTAELSAANAELARAARLKDEFLANMSHELRTPLNAILGMSEVLREHIYGPLNEKQLHAVGHIEEGGRHLLTLINDILDLSKIEAGKLELFMAPVSVENVCQASLRFIKQMAQKKRIEVTLALASPLGTLQADERRLKQILVNLLTNAVKFTPEGGQVRLEVGYEGGGEAIQFRVRDSGVGIAAEDMQRLFKPFVQLDSKLSRHHEGTGLGLSLVSRLTELHGGSVRVESQVGQGSQFTISLPCLGEGSPVEAVAHQPSGSPPAGLEKGSGQKRPLILLAEDNEANIETLRPYLGAKGYRLKVARNGSQAVQMAQEERPAVILMDIQMPVLDGLEAIRQLRANGHFAGVPIIALTALAMPGDRERCLAAGANEYLSKPVSLKDLVELIEQMLPFETWVDKTC
ncbi:MAG: response regulator [Anaerolineae bacterium]|nr:response regulator [Anaerolineae bacterium]